MRTFGWSAATWARRRVPAVGCPLALLFAVVGDCAAEAGQLHDVEAAGAGHTGACCASTIGRAVGISGVDRPDHGEG
ncbi:hypothetical protein ACF05L_33825 [Streptomyces bobili]|uniref:hypothetical protein n=1 Tax=Streptomyces bobili TaxID=67280 RepID=UPI00370297BD